MTAELEVLFVCVHNADPSTFAGERRAVLSRIAEVRDALKKQLEAWIQTLPATRRANPQG